MSGGSEFGVPEPAFQEKPRLGFWLTGEQEGPSPAAVKPFPPTTAPEPSLHTRKPLHLRRACPAGQPGPKLWVTMKGGLQGLSLGATGSDYSGSLGPQAPVWGAGSWRSLCDTRVAGAPRLALHRPF